MSGFGSGEVGEVIVDTYALLAIVYDEVGDEARDTLLRIREGKVKGLAPSTVAYEYMIHSKGRVPALRSVSEVITYLTTYITVTELSMDDWVRAAEVKVSGDSELRKASSGKLKHRALSMEDSKVIAAALREKAPILTGDKGLTYVAEVLGIRIIW